ncbi:MAG: Flp family type IVb pilin [Kiloniellales bacterium]|nr:Flp family type IVb pilin [Kiloniellales bacterium]
MGPAITALAGFLRDQRGATAAEYALLLALVSGGLAVSAVGLGESISNSMNETSALIDQSGCDNNGQNNGQGTGFGGGNGGGKGQGAGNGQGNSC